MFGVPHKKIKAIEQLMERIKFEVFLDENSSNKSKREVKEPNSQLVNKITLLLTKFLSNRICLDTVSEVLQIVKLQEQKLELY